MKRTSMILYNNVRSFTAQKMKFSISNFFSKCDQVRKKLRIWSHVLKKSLLESFIFFAVIPNGGLTGESFYWNLCYNKFVKITCKSTEFTTKTSTTAIQILSVKPRSKRKSSTKMQTLSSLTRKRPKIQSSTLPIHYRVPAALIKTFSWNKFVFEKECANCGK